MIYNRKTRRAFLKGAGGLFFSLPFFPAFLEKAGAQTSTTHLKRMICIFINSGSGELVWFPQIPSSSLTTTGPGYKARSLVDILSKTGKISPIFNDPRFNKYASHLNLYMGLDASTYSGHNKTVPFSGHSVGDRSIDGVPKNATIDYYVSRASHIYSTEPHSKNNILGVANSGNNWNGPTTSFVLNQTGEVIQNPPILNPMAAWDYYFKGLILGGGNQEEQLAKLKLKNKSILDTVIEDYKRLIASQYLANSEKASLEAHLDNFRDLEKKVSNVQAFTCGQPPTRASDSMFKSHPKNIAEGQFRVSSDLPKVMDIMVDIVATAMKCQLTNVASIMLDAANLEFSFLKLVDAGHGLSHRRVATTEMRAQANDHTAIMQSLMISKVVDLAEKLDIPDPTNTSENMLNNTLIVGSNEFGTIGNHRPWSMPAFTLGGGKKINNGWLIDYRGPHQVSLAYSDADITGIPAYHGRDYNSFLIGCMLAMGLQPSDWEKPGVPGFGSYNFYKDDKGYYAETENLSATKGGVITPGRKSAPPFMLKA